MTVVVVKFYRENKDRITENTSPVDEADQVWNDNPLYFDMEEVINDREYNDTEVDIGKELDKEEEAENDMNQPVENHEEKETSRLEADLAETNRQEVKEEKVEPNTDMNMEEKEIVDSKSCDQRELIP